MATTTKALETEVELLKKEVQDMAKIHARLDTAIEKIADVSQSLHTIMAVHEEKLMRQEEALENQEEKLQANIMELHSRITSNAKEQTHLMNEMERRLVDAMKEHNRVESAEFQRLRNDIQGRVGVLEKWRYLIIGGSIVAGFVIQAIMKVS
jgi:predicted  nucleic acid-binding Zn-ribbon protein